MSKTETYDIAPSHSLLDFHWTWSKKSESFTQEMLTRFECRLRKPFFSANFLTIEASSDNNCDRHEPNSGTNNHVDHRVLGPPVCCSPLLTEVHRATSHEPEAAGSSVRECGALDEVLLAVSGGAVGLGALWRLYLREYLW